MTNNEEVFVSGTENPEPSSLVSPTASSHTVGEQRGYPRTETDLWNVDYWILRTLPEALTQTAEHISIPKLWSIGNDGRIAGISPNEQTNTARINLAGEILTHAIHIKGWATMEEHAPLTATTHNSDGTEALSTAYQQWVNLGKETVKTIPLTLRSPVITKDDLASFQTWTRACGEILLAFIENYHSVPSSFYDLNGNHTIMPDTANPQQNTTHNGEHYNAYAQNWANLVTHAGNTLVSYDTNYDIGTLTEIFTWLSNNMQHLWD